MTDQLSNQDCDCDFYLTPHGRMVTMLTKEHQHVCSMISVYQDEDVEHMLIVESVHAIVRCTCGQVNGDCPGMLRMDVDHHQALNDYFEFMQLLPDDRPSLLAEDMKEMYQEIQDELSQVRTKRPPAI